MELVEIDALATTGPNLDVVDLRAPKNVHLIRGAPHDLVMKDVSVGYRKAATEPLPVH